MDLSIIEHIQNQKTLALILTLPVMELAEYPWDGVALNVKRMLFFRYDHFIVIVGSDINTIQPVVAAIHDAQVELLHQGHLLGVNNEPIPIPEFDHYYFYENGGENAPGPQFAGLLQYLKNLGKWSGVTDTLYIEALEMNTKKPNFSLERMFTENPPIRETLQQTGFQLQKMERNYYPFN